MGIVKVVRPFGESWTMLELQTLGSQQITSQVVNPMRNHVGEPTDSEDSSESIDPSLLGPPRSGECQPSPSDRDRGDGRERKIPEEARLILLPSMLEVRRFRVIHGKLK